MSEFAQSQVGTRRYFAAMAVTLVALALFALLNPATIDGRFNPLFDEDGPVEALSALGYFACALLIVVRGGAAFAWNRAFPIIVILMFLAFRELDFHTRFTTMGIMKLSFYLSDEVPLVEKLFALLALGLVGWAVVHIVAVHGRAFLAGLRRLEPVNVAVAVSAALVILSKAIDGMERKLGDFGITLSGEGVAQFIKVEETLELGVPLFAIVAVMAYFGSRSGGE